MFSIILPSIATGVLHAKFTNGSMNVIQTILGQSLGGLLFALLSGQPLVVIATTLVVALFNKVIYSLAQSENVPFLTLHAICGLWCCLFLILFALFNLSNIAKLATRSTREIFSMFIVIAFVKSALTNTEISQGLEFYQSFILMLGTFWLANQLFEFKNSLYFNALLREIISSYALPISVLFMSCINTFVFPENINIFSKNDDDHQVLVLFKIVPFENVSNVSIFVGLGLGFCLSLLIFMSQNINNAIVDSVDAPNGKLVKGSAYHWDLIVIGLINAFLGLFGLPFMHAILPQSPLHVKALTDYQDVKTDHGKATIQIPIYVQETRLTSILSNVLIGLILFCIQDVMNFIPNAVLNGLFLYLAFRATDGNQFFQRIQLLLQKVDTYPSFLKTVPWLQIHFFTAIQVVQLVFLCCVGFTFYTPVRTSFPVIIFLLLLIRKYCLPFIIKSEYLDVLDG